MKFRTHHLHQIFTEFKHQTYPLDVFLSNYFRKHKALGSKDRKYLSEILYEKIKWRSLVDYLKIPIEEPFSPLSYIKDTSIPEHIRLAVPEELFQTLLKNYSPEDVQKICVTLTTQAPTTVRVNLIKISREKLFENWQKIYNVSLSKHSNAGIIFHKKINFFALEEFKEGLFEIQDEASQLIADLVNPKNRDQILDFCAGAGGKTLAFAPKTNNCGQIYLHDIRPNALLQAKKRIKRAGIQNVQFSLPSNMKGKMNWVLVDAPCSGSGTYRRNPDLKWKFSNDMLNNVIQDQRSIFKQALDYLLPNGKIIYATCSILKEENEKQAAYFEETFNLQTEKTFISLPKEGEMDGFFGIVFKRK